MEVENLNVVGFHDRVAGAGVDAADAVVGQARRPEETARRDTRIEVGELCAPRTGGIDVNSYERERALARFAVDTAVDALHETAVSLPQDGYVAAQRGHHHAAGHYGPDASPVLPRHLRDYLHQDERVFFMIAVYYVTGIV